MKHAPLAVLAAAQGAAGYSGAGAKVWSEIRAFVGDLADWASRNLVAVLIAAVAIAFLWGLVFGQPKRR